MQHKDIDAYLNTALIAFVIAMPTLAFGFLCTFYKKPRIAPHSGPSNIFAATLVGAWVGCRGCGLDCSLCRYMFCSLAVNLFIPWAKF